MIVAHVQFIRPVPVLGSGIRQDQFTAADGWLIEVHDFGVTISRPANPGQNIPETPAFCTCGVGYSIPAAEPSIVDPVITVDASGKPEPYYRKGKR